MKIAFVTSSLHGGGITSYAHEVVDCFASKHEMSVVVGDDSQNPFDNSKVKVYRCESNDKSIDNARKLLRLINNEIKPDVVINSNSELMTLVLPFIENSIRYVTVSHSLRYNEADNAGINSRYADRLVALSTYNEEYLRKQYHIDNPEKVKVIYNFVDELENSVSLRLQKVKQTPLRIVYAGGTSAAKTPELVFDVLVQLLKTDREFEFIFMGSNSPTSHKIQPYKSITELIEPDSRVKFTGRVSRQEAEQIISSANIFLIPSRREGCPMAMLEAMRVGCIVITSDYKNACREMITDGKSGFMIPNNNKQAFVERIIDIIDHHDSYTSFYQACYEEFESRFSFPHWRKRMVELISDGKLLHEERIEGFSEEQYTKMRRRMDRRKKYNLVHMLLHEKIKSTMSFYFKYFRKKL